MNSNCLCMFLQNFAEFLPNTEELAECFGFLIATTTRTAENFKFSNKEAVGICCPPLHIKIAYSFVKLDK